MSLTTPNICTRTNDAKYTSAALVTGASVDATLTRDSDVYNPHASVSATTTPAAFYTPTSGETGTVYVVLFDGTYYAYQEFTFDAALTIAEVAASKLVTNAGAKLSVITAAGGALKIATSAGTGTAKIRLSVVKG